MKCGGCTWQNIEYGVQLERKARALKNLLLNAVGEIPEIRIVGSAPYSYRERVQFHKIIKSQSAGKISRYKMTKASAGGFGFKARQSDEIIAVNDCPVASPVIREALQNGAIKIPLDMDRWNVYGRGAVLLSEADNPRGIVKILDKELLVDASCFFQSNGALLEKLIIEVLEIAKGAAKESSEGAKERAGDFYCGAGTFAVFLADIFEKIDLLEANRASLNLAKENLRRLAARDGDRFFLMTDTQWAKKTLSVSKDPRYKDLRYAFLIADPARDGLSPPARETLCKIKPHVLCYVSCNPNSLARDAKFLLEGGFNLERLTLYDFYPQTPHIESLAVFKSDV